MKTTITIFLLSVTSVIFSQHVESSGQPYILVIGNDTFLSQTHLEKSPNLWNRYSPDLKSLEVNIVYDTPKSDTVEQYQTSLDSSILRESIYLFKNDVYRISFPQRIDTFRLIDVLTLKSYTKIDTSDYININRLVNSINSKELNKLANTEIEVYQGFLKLEVERIGVKIVWPDGQSFSTNYGQTKIIGDETIKDIIDSLPKESYVILDTVWFYTKENERKTINGAIGWELL